MATERKVVLVTGCSKGGIGYALCEEYANRGCRVYATARHLESMASFQNPNIEKLALDVLSDEQVKSVVDTIIKNEGRIDVLVNNAGANCAGAAVDIPIAVARQTFEVNFFGPLRIIQAVFPHMASRKSGTIVNVGSVVGETATAWNGMYSSSKAAIHRLSDVLYQECKPFNIDVVCVVPAAIKSNIADNALKSGIVMPENSLYKPYTDAIVNRVLVSQGPSSMPAAEMARMTVSATLSPSPPLFLLLGGNSFTFKLFAWLPKTWVLNLLWRRFRGTPKASS